MDKEYIAHEQAFHKNLEDFKQGVIDYFLESPSNESDNYYYNEGANFGDQLYCEQEDMIIDGKHKSLHGE